MHSDTPLKTEKENKAFSRRTFLKKALAGGGLCLLGGTGYMFWYEPRNVRFEQRQLEIPNLPDAWIGKKIVQVSDIHSSPEVPASYINGVFEKIAVLQPDVLLITGDCITAESKYMDTVTEAVKKVTPAIEGGKLAVIGNHDLWTSRRCVREGLEKAGVQVLINRSVKLGDTGATLAFAGIDDLWRGEPDLKKTLQGIDPEKDPFIFLSHNPDIFPEAVKKKIPVTLAGHTHGGQVVIPFVGALVTPSRYCFKEGFYRKDGCVMYVNRGLGLISLERRFFPAVRFNCPPEVTTFTLVRRP